MPLPRLIDGNVSVPDDFLTRASSIRPLSLQLYVDQREQRGRTPIPAVKYCLQKGCLEFYMVSIKSCLSNALINNSGDIYVFQQEAKQEAIYVT